MQYFKSLFYQIQVNVLLNAYKIFKQFDIKMNRIEKYLIYERSRLNS